MGWGSEAGEVEKDRDGEGGEGRQLPSALKATVGTLALTLGREARGKFWVQETGCLGPAC